MRKRRVITVLSMAVALSTAIGYGSPLVYAEMNEKEAISFEELAGVENAALVLNQNSGSNDITLALEFSEEYEKSVTSFEVLIQLDQSKIKNVTMSWNEEFTSNQCRYTYDTTTGELKLYVVDKKDLLNGGKITIGKLNLESDATENFHSYVVLEELKIVDLQHNSDAVTVDRTEQSFEWIASVLPPSTDEPSTDNPSTDKPSTDEPSTDGPSTDIPSTDKPSAGNPSTDGSGVTTPSDILVQDIQLDKTKETLEVGKTVSLTATVLPSNASNRSVTWSSDNEKVAKVSSDGKVTAVGKGTATITVCSNDGTNVKATAVITVKATSVSATKVKLSKTSLVLKPKQSKTLKATVLPSKTTNKSVVWSSSNPEVATVKNGKIVAKSVGTTTITVKTKDGSKKKATCVVTVANIKLNKKKATLNKGEKLTLKATVSGESQKVTWKSSNSKIATVTKSGKVTAKKAGTATITAKANGVKVTFKVTVKK